MNINKPLDPVGTFKVTSYPTSITLFFGLVCYDPELTF